MDVWETIRIRITDDGSTDGTAQIIRAYDDPRIDFETFGANQGACEALNRCIARATGEYIAVISSDDYFLPGKLARQVEILDAAPELAAVFGLPRFIDDDGAAIPPEQNPVAGVFSTAPADRFAWLRHFFLNGNALCHSTVMVRRRIYEELGDYDVALRQFPDMDMWVRICAQYPIRVLPEPLTAFRILSGLQNTSAGSPPVLRRCIWEHSQVLRRYRAMDEATLERAFGADIPPHAAERGLPMALQIALMAAEIERKPYVPDVLQLYALETMEDAVRRGVPGVGPKDLHKLTGELDPFRLTEVGELVVARERVQQDVAIAKSERDKAFVHIAGLQARLERKAATAQEAAARHLQLQENVAQLLVALARNGSVVLSLCASQTKAAETIAALEITRLQADRTIQRLREELTLLANVLGLREQHIAALAAALSASLRRGTFARTVAASAHYRTALASFLATTFLKQRLKTGSVLRRVVGLIRGGLPRRSNRAPLEEPAPGDSEQR